MLVVLAVIGVLLGLIFPGLGLVRRNAQNTQCLSNLRQLGGTISGYMNLNNGMLPNCEFLPAATSSGPVGGLPSLLDGHLDAKCEAWCCPADHDEASLSTGTSYFYMPGLLKLVPPIQLAVVQMLAAHPPGTITQTELDRRQREIESRLVAALIGSDPKRKYPLLLDSQDRHGAGRHPRNGLFVDGSVGELVEHDEEEYEGDAEAVD